MSLVVAAYNEEKIIRQKIIHDLSLDYPKDKIEIIVISDGSNDTTPEIVNEFKENGIISLYQSVRYGKTAALNRAIKVAKNEIVIFSDANSMFRLDAVKKLVRHFFDSDVGGVCGRKSIVINNGRTASNGDSFYWRYESALKNAESNLGSIPTADGEIFAIRKELYDEIDPQIINDDMAITLKIISEGKRVIYEQDAISEEEASITLRDDFNVKARMVYGSIQILFLYKKLLNPFKSFFAVQFFFHKTLRWFMWQLLILLIVVNFLCLGKGLFYQSFFSLQILFYSMGVIGFYLDKSGYRFSLFYFPYYYCNVNFAACKGFVFYIKQKSTVEIWTKATR